MSTSSIAAFRERQAQEESAARQGLSGPAIFPTAPTSTRRTRSGDMRSDPQQNRNEFAKKE